jgi:hypothetical protein
MSKNMPRELENFWRWQESYGKHVQRRELEKIGVKF